MEGITVGIDKISDTRDTRDTLISSACIKHVSCIMYHVSCIMYRVSDRWENQCIKCIKGRKVTAGRHSTHIYLS